MNWFWMNIPLEVVFLALWIGIPLWLVARHPDRGPDAATAQLRLELEVLLSPAADDFPAVAQPVVAQPLAVASGSHEVLGESLERVTLVL